MVKYLIIFIKIRASIREKKIMTQFRIYHKYKDTQLYTCILDQKQWWENHNILVISI